MVNPSVPSEPAKELANTLYELPLSSAENIAVARGTGPATPTISCWSWNGWDMPPVKNSVTTSH